MINFKLNINPLKNQLGKLNDHQFIIDSTDYMLTNDININGADYKLNKKDIFLNKAKFKDDIGIDWETDE
jgi:hypothetical protein